MGKTKSFFRVKCNLFVSRTVSLTVWFLVMVATLFAQTPKIQVGADNSYFPFEYVDDNKQPQGFDIDLLAAIAEEAGFEYQVTTGDWFLVKDKMQSGSFDMLAGMYYNPDRAEHFDFSMPYIIITHSIFVKEGNKIGSLNELKQDKSIRVVVENSSILHKYLTANGVLPERILAVENQLDALLLVEDSYTTCALLPDLQAKYIARANGLEDIVTVGLPILPREYSFAVRKGDTALLNRLNQGLTKLHQIGKFEKIFEKWFGKYSPTYSVLEEDSSSFWLLALFLILLSVGMYFFMQTRWKKLLHENKAISSDLKQTKQVLNDIYKSETILKRIIEFSPFPIAMIHEEGYFVFTNNGFEEIFGKQQNIGGSVNKWLNSSFKREHERNFVKSQFFYNPKDLVSHSESNFTFNLTQIDGQEHKMNLFFVSLGNGQLLLFFYGFAEEFIPNNTGKSEVSKIVDTTFHTHYAYDIRTPMNAVLGFSEILMSEEEMTHSEVRHFSDLINANALILLQLIKNMGFVAKTNVGELIQQPDFIYVDDFLQNVVRQFHHMYSNKLQQDSGFVLLPSNTSVASIMHVDREILEQIFFNLLSFTLSLHLSKGVEIGHTLANKETIRFFIRFKIETEDAELLEEKLGMLEDADYRTIEKLNSSADLGLFISDRLLKLMGSKLEVEHKGMYILHFSLPNFVIQDPVAQYQQKKNSVSVGEFLWEGKKILIADNNPHSMLYFRSIFRPTKAKLILARDGREAYEQCRADKHIDLVIMDWLMPVMNGENSAKLIKQLNPALPIIAVTSFALADERRKIIQSGCNAYFPKPFDPKELLNYIQGLFLD